MYVVSMHLEMLNCDQLEFNSQVKGVVHVLLQTKRNARQSDEQK